MLMAYPVTLAAGASLGYLTWLEFSGWYFAHARSLPWFLVFFMALAFYATRLVFSEWDNAPRLMLTCASVGVLVVHAGFALYAGSLDLTRLGFADVFVLEAAYVCGALLPGGLGYIIGKGVNHLWRI